MSNSSLNNKRIAKNTLLLYFRMLLMMAIGLYTSRVILDKLGEVDFGIYNVVGGFVTMFSIISGAMTTATQRFLSFEIGKGNKGNVKDIFSTMLIIHIFLGVIILLVGETVGTWFLNNYMNFPPNRYEAANWVFQFSLLVFILNVINVPYNGALIAYEKMSAFAYFSIIDAVLKLAICYIIVMTPFDRLIVYAVLMALVQTVIILTYYLYCKRTFPECHFSCKFNQQYGKAIVTFVGWNLIGSLSGVAKEQGVNVVLNMFFGPAVNAARGIAYQVLSKLNGFVSNFQMAMNPQIIKNYAVGEREAMYKLVFRGAKLSYLLLLMLSLPVVIEAPLILGVWLKEVPAYTVIFLRLAILTALLNTLSNPLIVSMHASGKVRDYQIVVGTISLLTLPIVYAAFKYGAEPYYAMIIAFAVELICHIARLYMLVRSIGFPMLEYLRNVTLMVFIITLLSLIFPLIAYSLIGNEVIRFFSVCIISIISTIFLGFYIAFSKNERVKIRRKVSDVVKNRFNKYKQ